MHYLTFKWILAMHLSANTRGEKDHFLIATKIKELKETEITIPRHKFEFVEYDTILQHFNKHVQLSSIL